MSYFSLDYQKTRRKMSTVTITTPASTLRLSPLRVEDLLQGAIMLIVVFCFLVTVMVMLMKIWLCGQCFSLLTPRYKVSLKIYCLKDHGQTKDKYFYSRSADFTTPSPKSQRSWGWKIDFSYHSLWYISIRGCLFGSVLTFFNIIHAIIFKDKKY